MSILDEAPKEVEKYSGKEYSEIPIDALIKLAVFHYKCSKGLSPMLAKDHKKILEEISEEIKKRLSNYKNMKASLKESIKKGLIIEEDFIKEILKTIK